MSDENMSALYAWIKKDQEERRKHAEYMARKNSRDDELYIKQIKELMTECKLSTKEKMFLTSLSNSKKLGKNFSPSQRSALNNLFYKHFYKESM